MRERKNASSFVLHGASCGKLLLFGEHLVFHRSPAFGIPLPLGLEAQCTASFSNEELSIVSDTAVRPEFIAHIRAVSNKEGLAVPGGTIAIQSKIPVGSGWGSSAALCTALAAIILQYNSKTTTNTACWHLAHQLEQYFHTPASGIDTAISSFSCSLLLLPTDAATAGASIPALQAIPRSTSWQIVTGVVPRIDTCAELIERAAKTLKETAQLQSLKKLNQKAIDLLLEEKTILAPEHFAKTVESIQQHLTDLGLSTSSAQRAIKTALETGASAAKLSGAGGGGAFVCFCSNRKTALRVQQQLTQLPDLQNVMIL